MGDLTLWIVYIGAHDINVLKTKPLREREKQLFFCFKGKNEVYSYIQESHYYYFRFGLVLLFAGDYK